VLKAEEKLIGHQKDVRSFSLTTRPGLAYSPKPYINDGNDDDMMIHFSVLMKCLVIFCEEFGQLLS
jgi:hypothetical protein